MSVIMQSRKRNQVRNIPQVSSSVFQLVSAGEQYMMWDYYTLASTTELLRGYLGSLGYKRRGTAADPKARGRAKAREPGG